MDDEIILPESCRVEDGDLVCDTVESGVSKVDDIQKDIERPRPETPTPNKNKASKDAKL